MSLHCVAAIFPNKVAIEHPRYDLFELYPLAGVPFGKPLV
jgi:hypothetical protein